MTRAAIATTQQQRYGALNPVISHL